MPKVVENFEFKRSGFAATNTQDWDTLLDGQTYQLTQGEDFDSKPASMAMLARKYANKRGLALRVSINEAEGTVTIKANGPVRPRKAEGEGTVIEEATQVNGHSETPTVAPKVSTPAAAQQPATPKPAAPKPTAQASPAAKPAATSPKPAARAK